MNAKTQFNPVSGATFSGRNETAVLNAIKEHGYKSNRWITYFQAKELDMLDGVNLKGKAVGMIRFAKNNGKSQPVWYNVFNLDLFTDVPAALLKAKAKKAPKKSAKKAPKKAAKAAPKKAAKQNTGTPVIEAIPVQGKPNTYLVKGDNGVYTEVVLNIGS